MMIIVHNLIAGPSNSCVRITVNHKYNLLSIQQQLARYRALQQTTKSSLHSLISVINDCYNFHLGMITSALEWFRI